MRIQRPSCSLFAPGSHERAPDPVWVDTDRCGELEFSLSVQQADEEDAAFYVEFRLEHSADGVTPGGPVPKRAVLSEGYRYTGEVFATRRETGHPTFRNSPNRDVSALALFTFRVRVGQGLTERYVRTRPQFMGQSLHAVTLHGRVTAWSQ